MFSSIRGKISALRQRLRASNKTIFILMTTLILAIALPLMVFVSQQEQDLRQRAGGFEPTPPLPITSGKITSCGTISQSGTYVMDTDINATGNRCISIENVNDVHIDCKGHSIILDQQNLPYTDTDPFRPLLGIINVKNFSINSCILKVINVSGPPPPVTVSKSSNGIISNNTFYDPSVMSNTAGLDYFNVIIEHTSNVKFSGNTVYAVYQQRYSDNITIENNNFYPTLKTLKALESVVSLDRGNHNLIQGNTIDGKWDGTQAGFKNVGADDGIVLADESDDVIKGNKIQNNWDCGIETTGLIKNTTIEGNIIIKSGICGIGAWYHNSWKDNLVSDNIIDSAPQLFYFFRLFGLRPGENFVYFTNNTFSGNKFLNPTRVFLPSYISFQGFVKATNSEERDVTDQSYIVKNNKFTNNDFNSKLRAPLFAPTSMAIDGGRNICGAPAIENYSNIEDFPLKCVGQIAVSPTPSARPLACGTYGDINQDNIIAQSDAQLLLNYVGGSQSLNDKQKLASDLNRDGKINIQDSILLQQYVAGRINTFLACTPPTATPTPTPVNFFSSVQATGAGGYTCYRGCSSSTTTIKYNDTTHVQEGIGSAKISIGSSATENRGFFALTSQNINVGTPLHALLYLWGINGKTYDVRFRAVNSSGGNIEPKTGDARKVITGNNNWQLVDLTWTAPSSLSQIGAEVFSNTAQGTSFWVDSLYVGEQ